MEDLGQNRDKLFNKSPMMTKNNKQPNFTIFTYVPKNSTRANTDAINGPTYTCSYVFSSSYFSITPTYLC